MKKVSVIVPVYNTDKYVKDCLQSIKNQTYKNIEVFVIDDGSLDNSGLIASKFCEENDNFFYHRKENGGTSSARNLGLSLATGEYISFIDGDDTIEETFIEELVSNIKENDVFCGLTGIYKVVDGVKHEYYTKKESLGIFKTASCCLKLFQRKYIDELNLKFENSSMGEDSEFTAKLLIYNNNYSVVDNKYLYNYYMREDSATHTYDEKLYSLLDVINRIETFAKEHSKYQQFKDALEYMNISHVLLGLMKRVKNIEGFNNKDVDKLLKFVENKYPNWINNCYLNRELNKDELHYLNNLSLRNYDEIFKFLEQY